MTTVTIHQAKTQLSKLIAKAEAGEEVVITRGKTPVAKLTSLGRQKEQKGQKVQLTFGMLKGRIPDLPDEFFFDSLSDKPPFVIDVYRPEH
jgi:prevent-host-death family protein